MQFPNFLGPSDPSQAQYLDQQRLVNWYLERAGSPGATTALAAVNTPGVEKLTLLYPAMSQPSTPTITNQGAAGATSYGYRIVAYLADAVTHTQGSLEGTTATGNATLDGTNFNRVTWTAVTNAHTYRVYRTTPNPPVLLSTVSAPTVTYDDIGGAGTPEEQAKTNTSGVEIAISGNGRAHFWEPGTEREFAVIGSVFGEITGDSLFTPRGVVAADSNPATISSLGRAGGQLLITSGGLAYSFVLSSNAFAVLTAQLTGVTCTMGAAIDGYGLVFDITTGRTYFSSLNTIATWDLTDFFGRSKAPDPLMAMVVANGYIYLVGSETTEVWYNAGEFPIPFVFHPSGLIQYGTAASFSPEVAGNALWWLSATRNGQGVVVRTRGFGPEIMSTQAVTNSLNQLSELSDAVGDTYEDRGHTFYVLTLPSSEKTWVADTDLPAALAWAERDTWIAESGHSTAWRPLFHAFAQGEHRMLDRSAGVVYRMSSTLYGDVPDEDGNPRPIRRVRETPTISRENRLLSFPGLEIDFEVGLGLTTGQGSDPQVMLQWSDDGGKTWSNEIWTSAGALGHYDARVRFLRLGAARKRMFRIVVTDPIAWRMTGATLIDFERANPGVAGRERAA